MKFVVSFALTVFAGCASLPDDPSADIPEAELISGVALVGYPVAPSAGDVGSILAVDASMDRFVKRHVGSAVTGTVKLQRLLAGMREEGLLGLDYQSDATLTAAEVFHSKRGNCLSSTNLFVALARHAGLSAVFQRVEIPPVWLAESGFVILDQHVNAKVTEVRRPGTWQPDWVVDFNQTRASSGLEQVQVSDNYAFALYFNNLAVDNMKAGALDAAVAHLARAMQLAPSIPGLWVNLGALYSKHEKFEHAIAAYRVALRVDATSKPALSNLASLHEYLGNPALAREYRRQVTQYQNRNPYYHFALARDALDRGAYSESLASIERAIRLESQEHEFYFLKGVVETNLGDLEGARESLHKARRYAEPAEARRYDAKLEALAHLGP